MVKVKERPILFSSEMVRAILDGQKTQTRRVIKPQPTVTDFFVRWRVEWSTGRIDPISGEVSEIIDEWRCPYGQPGDRLWVRETWRIGAWKQTNNGYDDFGLIAVDYKADNYARQEWLKAYDSYYYDKLVSQSVEDAQKANSKKDEYDYFIWEPGKSPCRWRPSIFMPRWASRLQLEITDIKIERVQDITEEDAHAEGVTPYNKPMYADEDLPTYKNAFWRLWDQINAKRGRIKKYKDPEWNYWLCSWGKFDDPKSITTDIKHPELIQWRDPQDIDNPEWHSFKDSAPGCEGRYEVIWEPGAPPVLAYLRRYDGKEHVDFEYIAPYAWEANPWVWVIEFKKIAVEQKVPEYNHVDLYEQLKRDPSPVV